MFHNTNLELRVYRYFLQEQVKGGDVSIELDELEDLICETEPQYIFFVSTEEALYKGYDIEKESKILVKVHSCSPLEFDVVELEFL